MLKAEKTGSHEYLRMQALARIFLDNIPNVQSSWVTQGPAMGQVALKFGANDFGSLMMEENVVSSAGTSFRLTLEEMRRLIVKPGLSQGRETIPMRSSTSHRPVWWLRQIFQIVAGGKGGPGGAGPYRIGRLGLRLR